MTRTPPKAPDPNCTNCDGRGCMSCVLRYVHDYCEDDCPFCCRQISDGATETFLGFADELDCTGRAAPAEAALCHAIAARIRELAAEVER